MAIDSSKIVTGIASWLDAGLSFVYPDVCQHCRESRATRKDGYVCPACWRNVRFIVPPICDRCGLPFEGDISDVFECTNCREMDLQFCRARSAVAAKGMVLEIIHRWKYQRALWFEPFLSSLLVREAGPALREDIWDLIVPVPLHPLKQSEREFNQAEHLARSVGLAANLRVGTRIVRRVTPTRTQTQLTRTERAANMRGAFAPGPCIDQVRGKRIVLVDDVMTTGATTSACAAVLRSGGAVEVCVWTVARGLLH